MTDTKNSKTDEDYNQVGDYDAENGQSDPLIDNETPTESEKVVSSIEKSLWWFGVAAFSIVMVKVIINWINMIIAMGSIYLQGLGYDLWNGPAFFLAIAVGVSAAYYFEPTWMLGSARNLFIILSYCCTVLVLTGEVSWLIKMWNANTQCNNIGFVASVIMTSAYPWSDHSALCGNGSGGLYSTLTWYFISAFIQIAATLVDLVLLIIIHNKMDPLQKLLTWVNTNTKNVLKKLKLTDHMITSRHKKYSQGSEDEILSHLGYKNQKGY